MEYVMVPVPEELVGQVTRYLNLNLRGWFAVEPQALEQFVSELEDRELRFVTLVAEALESTEGMTVAAASAAIGCSEREVLGLVVQLNGAIQRAGGPALTFAPVREETTDGTVWHLTLIGDAAALFLRATGRG